MKLRRCATGSTICAIRAIDHRTMTHTADMSSQRRDRITSEYLWKCREMRSDDLRHICGAAVGWTSVHCGDRWSRL